MNDSGPKPPRDGVTRSLDLREEALDRAQAGRSIVARGFDPNRESASKKSGGG